MEAEKEIKALVSPTVTLETMRVNCTEIAPNYQRSSVETTIRRIRDKSSKRFALSRTNDIYFTIKRIR